MSYLLGEIKRVRDECRAACSDLLPSADPLGDARMAYGVVADRLTEIITMSEQRNDTCGLCGELGADKLPHPEGEDDEEEERENAHEREMVNRIAEEIDHE